MRNNLLLMLCFIPLYNLAFASETLDDLTEYMQYLAERDKVLSLNIANADTPKYKPKDLSRYSVNNDENVRFITTNPMHISLDENPHYRVKESEIMELKPNGNAVDVEHELYQKSMNAVRLQEITNLYAKTRDMITTAVTGHR